LGLVMKPFNSLDFLVTIVLDSHACHRVPRLPDRFPQEHKTNTYIGYTFEIASVIRHHQRPRWYRNIEIDQRRTFTFAMSTSTSNTHTASDLTTESGSSTVGNLDNGVLDSYFAWCRSNDIPEAIQSRTITSKSCTNTIL
jgi:hypothetical protein